MAYQPKDRTYECNRKSGEIGPHERHMERPEHGAKATQSEEPNQKHPYESRPPWWPRLGMQQKSKRERGERK
jgi:hypothetical protein